MMDMFSWAVLNNDMESVRLLVEQGADKDKGDKYGDTPLFLASFKGYLEMAQYLVEQGAALDKANSKGITPLIVASKGELELCRYLLEKGADRDKSCNRGMTPLHWAANYGQLAIAMLLMSYGADLNARNSGGHLPIDIAHTEEMKQAIRDEPRRRMDHGYKRATEQDRHPNTATSASVQQKAEDEEENEEEQQSNMQPCLDEGAVVATEVEETKVAEEDEDSEPSDGEEDD